MPFASIIALAGLQAVTREPWAKQAGSAATRLQPAILVVEVAMEEFMILMSVHMPRAGREGFL